MHLPTNSDRSHVTLFTGCFTNSSRSPPPPITRILFSSSWLGNIDLIFPTAFTQHLTAIIYQNRFNAGSSQIDSKKVGHHIHLD